jgi:hypothetical protein
MDVHEAHGIALDHVRLAEHQTERQQRDPTGQHDSPEPSRGLRAGVGGHGVRGGPSLARNRTLRHASSSIGPKARIPNTV